jgi:hypothetical protein
MLTLLAQLLPAAPQAPIAPSWVVLPLSLLALFVVAGHWILLGRAEMPRFRKSLRTANGLVMMLAIPVLAFGFGVVSPSNARLFTITWMLASGLLMLVLLLAAVDLIHTNVIARREQERLSIEIRAARAALAAKLSAAVAKQSASGAATVAPSEASPSEELASTPHTPNAGSDGRA